uniref:MATH domain-containing protein n=1 Tax=Ditylenchus dipsaci TaxID=166011 RepID=A0A915CTQ2_9BILA
MQVTASAITSKQTMKISFDKSSMSPIKSNNVNFLGDEWYLRMDNDGVSFQINTFFLGCSRRSIFFLKEFVCLSLNRAYGPSSSASDIIYEIRFMGSADQSLTVRGVLANHLMFWTTLLQIPHGIEEPDKLGFVDDHIFSESSPYESDFALAVDGNGFE